jgi:hypothetical protein
MALARTAGTTRSRHRLARGGARGRVAKAPSRLAGFLRRRPSVQTTLARSGQSSGSCAATAQAAECTNVHTGYCTIVATYKSKTVHTHNRTADATSRRPRCSAGSGLDSHSPTPRRPFVARRYRAVGASVPIPLAGLIGWARRRDWQAAEGGERPGSSSHVGVALRVPGSERIQQGGGTPFSWTADGRPCAITSANAGASRASAS